MLGLTPEPSPLEQGQDAALYHAMSPSSTTSDNSKMASKGIPISRGDSNSEYMLMSPQQQQAPSATLLKRGTPPSSYSNKTNMEIPLKSAGKRNGAGTISHLLIALRYVSYVASGLRELHLRMITTTYSIHLHSGQEYEMMSPVDNSEKLSRRVLEEAAVQSTSHSPMPLSAIEERLSGVR